MVERYKWALSPSRFEAASGCPCYEEDPRQGMQYKTQGTNLHEYMENPDWKTDDLEPQDQQAVESCRLSEAEFKKQIGHKVILEERELYLKKTNVCPGGTIDLLLLFEDGTIAVLDWKFGQMAVTTAQDNPQVKAYVLMAVEWLRDQKLNPKRDRFHLYELMSKDLKLIGGIVQPALDTVDLGFFELADLEPIERELKKANERITDPFKKPDPSDSTKCQRCKHITRCPAVTHAVNSFVEQVQLLPTPASFDPAAIVSVKDRLLAQELAKILGSWADAVVSNNKEYALANDNTLGDVWNITYRGNGYEVKDVLGLAEELVKRELISAPEELLHFAKVTKTGLSKGLEETSLDDPKEAKNVVNELFETLGEEKPPVMVFRKGGKKKIQPIFEELNIPMLDNPFK